MALSCPPPPQTLGPPLPSSHSLFRQTLPASTWRQVRTLKKRNKVAESNLGAAQAECHAATSRADERGALAARLQSLLAAKEVRAPPIQGGWGGG